MHENNLNNFILDNKPHSNLTEISDFYTFIWIISTNFLITLLQFLRICIKKNTFLNLLNFENEISKVD